MSEDKELKDLLDDVEIDDADSATEDEKAQQKSRHRERIQELGRKYLSEKKEKEKIEKEKEKLEKEKKEFEFSHEFLNQSAKYPYAKDHENEIRDHVAKGLSVEDATLLILSKQKKLLSPEEIKKAEEKKSSLGGSSNVNLQEGGKKQPKDMTQQERLEALKEAEEKGEIVLN